MDNKICLQKKVLNKFFFFFNIHETVKIIKFKKILVMNPNDLNSEIRQINRLTLSMHDPKVEQRYDLK